MQSARAAAVAVLAAVAGCSGSHTTRTAASPSPAAYPTAVDAFEGLSGDDTPATASAIQVGEIQHRTLFPAGDVDWVAVDLEAGVKYEISADRLSAAADVVVYAFEPDGVTTVPLGEHFDDYIDLDAEIAFTAAQTGRYLVRIQSVSDSHGVRNGLASYTLSVHLFVDADGDGVSSYYDCDDHDPSVSPFAVDHPGDGVDQDCDGMDALDPAAVDRFEPDDDPSHAKPLLAATDDAGEQLYEHALYAANARTIHGGNDDWVTFTARPHEKISLSAILTSSAATPADTPSLAVYAASDLVNPVLATQGFSGEVVNDSAAPQTYYARYRLVSGAAFYVPWQLSLGFDLDGDGYFSRDWDELRDCNDANPDVHPNAPETPGDHVDSNCDGRDDP